jgi:queuine/archaeosine tRNA-ribosyltransferase
MKFYFTSVTNDEYLKYLQDNDCCNILISYLEQRKIETLIEKNIPNISLFVDSGAFSAFTRNKKIDIDNYIEFLNTHHTKLDLYASLDVIPNYDSLESVRQSSIDTFNNFIYMRERLIDKNKCVVTFHFGEDYSMLKKILNYEDKYGKISYLALGGLARAVAEDRFVFIEKCYEIIKECHREDIKIHLFGVTDMSICERFGANSVDSTTWVRAASFGEICTDAGRLVVSENRINDDKHLLHKSELIKNECIKEMADSGFNIDDLMKSSKSRELYNILHFHKKSLTVSTPKFVNVSVKCVDLW